MREFLRPDGAFQWFKDGELIDTASARYSLTFRDSEAENTSQSGLRVLVPGRVSTLSILGPRQSDSGNYTCVVETTGVDIRLQVEGGGAYGELEYVIYTIAHLLGILSHYKVAFGRKKLGVC